MWPPKPNEFFTTTRGPSGRRAGEPVTTRAEATETFAPPQEFAAAANVREDAYERGAEDFERFWAEQSRELVDWKDDFTEVLDWSNPPFAKWFVGGKLNVAYNCVDRHVEAGRGDKVALYFEGEPGDRAAAGPGRG